MCKLLSKLCNYDFFPKFILFSIFRCDDPLYKDMKEQLAYKLRLGWQARRKSL